MPGKTLSMKKHLLGVAVAHALAASLSPLAFAQAQPVAPSVSELRRYDVPAGPLPEALTAFAAQAGVSLSFDPTPLANLRSPGVRGEFSVNDGFAKLLAGTGYQQAVTGDGEYTLKPAPQEAAVLKAVKVRSTGLDTTTEGTGSLTTAGPVAAATGLGISLRETPQSMTVVTRERIEQQNLNTLAEVAEQVTGVYYNSTGTPIGGRTWLYARGYMVNSYQIDGVNVPWEAMSESEQYGHGALDTAIYDAITVVRGSTGLMTGAGEPSALMALTRKKPTSEGQVILEATAGRWDRYRAMADVGGPLNEAGTLRGRVVGAYDEGKSWVDGYSSDRSIAYGVVEADLGPRTLLTVTLEHGNADSQGAPWAADYGVNFYFAGGVTPMQPSTTTSLAPHWAYLNSDRTFTSAALEHHFNDDWSAKLSYGYGRFNSDMRRGMVRSVPANGSLTAARVLDLEYHYDTHIVDIRVDGKYHLLGREHELVAGFNAYRTDKAAPVGYLGDPFPNLAYWSNGQLNYLDPDWDALPGSEDDYPFDTETKQRGAYLATRLRPTDRLAVILGGRVTHWETWTADRATAWHDYDLWDDREYDDEFTPYAGVVVDITHTLSAYVSYTQIFQPQDVRDVSGGVLDPIEGDTYEIGLKGAWFDGRLNASIAAFESKRENLAVALWDDEGNPVSDMRGGQAHRAEDHTEGRGWELEVAGALTERWQIQAGYSQFKNKNSAGDILDTTQPEQQFKLYTAYQPAFVPRLTIGGSLRWQDGTYVDGQSDRLYKIDSYFVAGLNADYAVNEQLSVAVNLNNAFDKEYRVSNYTHSYGAPRNASVTVRAKF